MILESITSLLGTELTKQVELALKGKGKDGKDVDVVIGNDGSMVPAEKFDAARMQSGSAEQALKAAAEALKAIGGSGDPAKVAEDVKTAQYTIEAVQANYEAEIKKLQKITALKMALADKVHDPADILPLLDVGALEVDDMGTLKTNIAPLLKPLQAAKPYLFKQTYGVKYPDIKGAKPAEPMTQSRQTVTSGGPIVI